MGDASDFADVERFMRTPEGKRVLDRFARGVTGKTVREVHFQNNTAGVGVALAFGDGDLLDLGEATDAFSVGSLRERYMRILEREYRKDFPGRGEAEGEPSAIGVEDLRCPACGLDESFSVEAHQCLTLFPDGTVTEGDEGQRWDETSYCRCGSCGHEATVADFLLK